ncbi:hypothetical protein [Duncaniella dubosii]|uniref:hypothetical protein n=1 Tax=Duncaniella dubosii TaxID=2518971 RepID=UPI003F66DA15
MTLYTYGDRWSYLQPTSSMPNAQPYYVILNDDGELLSGPYTTMRMWPLSRRSSKRV